MRSRKKFKVRKQGLTPKLIEFVRDIVAIPSPSGEERRVLERIKKEMEKVGWRKVRFDGAGNLRGQIGEGSRAIAIDAHADTVGSGDRREWDCDPYRGRLEKGWLWGRGTADQKGGLAAAVYAAEIIIDQGLEDDFILHLVVSVQEEDCEGLSWNYIIEEEGFIPEAVILTEPSRLGIKRGQRGHAEVLITTRGESAHSFCPQKGKNAIYSTARLVGRLEKFASRLPSHPQFGTGSLAVTAIHSESPSDNSVPDYCQIRVDRRFWPGATRDSILKEISDLLEDEESVITIPVYRRSSHAGKELRGEKFFPSWILEEDHPLITAARQTSLSAWGEEAPVGTWGFSTNGVSTMAKHGIPTFGLGPGREDMAHRPNERVEVEELLKASTFYAHFPRVYCRALI